MLNFLFIAPISVDYRLMILTCGICCVLSCGLPLPFPSSPCHYRDTLLTQRNWMQADDSISQAWVLPDQHCPPQSKTRVGQVPFDMMWGEDNRLLLSCLQVKKPQAKYKQFKRGTRQVRTPSMLSHAGRLSQPPCRYPGEEPTEQERDLHC